MNNIKFATPDEIRQPIGGLIVEPQLDNDHILGASGPDFEVLSEDGQWSNYAPNPELQRNRFGDTFMCVSFSNNNVHEFILQKRYGDIVDWSDIFLGKGSGTVRGQGNGKRTVAEWKRLNGFVQESDYPYTQDMTLDQVFAPIPTTILQKAKQNLEIYTFLYKWLSGNSKENILGGLRLSPVQVDVSGSYRTNSKGYIVWDKNNPVYSHEVVIFGYEKDECWYVFDSETMQFIKFDWSYPFGGPMIHSVKKKMNIKLYKKSGQSGIAVKHCSQPSMIVFSGGSVQGADLFKSLYGIKDFNQLEITEVPEWPFPVRDMINTNPLR